MPEVIVSLVKRMAPALSVGALSANLMRLEDDIARLASCGVVLAAL